MFWQLVHRGKGDRRRRTKHQRHRHLFAARLVFQKMLVNALVQLDLRVHPHPGRALHHRPVIPDILPPGVGVLGDEHRARRIGRIVEAGCRNRNWQAVDALARLVERRTLHHDVLAGRIFDEHRLVLVLFGIVPLFLDIFDLAADADAVNLPIRGKDSHRHRHVVAASCAVDDVLEQECLALRFRNAAAKLPAHQWVHLGIFVDWTLHADQQALLLQGGDVRVQVWIRENFHVSSDWSAGAVLTPAAVVATASYA